MEKRMNFYRRKRKGGWSYMALGREGGKQRSHVFKVPNERPARIAFAEFRLP